MVHDPTGEQDTTTVTDEGIEAVEGRMAISPPATIQRLQYSYLATQTRRLVHNNTMIVFVENLGR